MVAESHPRRLGVHQLTKRFGRTEVLRGVTFELRGGEILGLVGHNGAGKSTTLRLIAGLLDQDAGEIVHEGGDARIGFLSEKPSHYPELTPHEYVSYFARLRGRPRAEAVNRARAVLTEVGLHAHRDRIMKRFSKGMVQRACLARALVDEPSLLLLDEPESGLDPTARADLRAVVRARTLQGTAAILASHDLATVEQVCDRVLILRDGRIVHEERLRQQASGRYRIVVDSAIAEVAAYTLAALPTTLDVRRRGGEILVDVAAGTPPEGLVARLVAAGVGVRTFAPLGPNLETTYRRLAGELQEMP